MFLKKDSLNIFCKESRFPYRDIEILRCETKKDPKQFWFPLWFPKRDAKKYDNRKQLKINKINLLPIVILQNVMAPPFLCLSWTYSRFYIFVEGISHLCIFVLFFSKFCSVFNWTPVFFSWNWVVEAPNKMLCTYFVQFLLFSSLFF